MTINQLQAVLLSAKLGSVTLAAKEMNISQSNVSSYIKAVEEEMGYKILNRNHGGITATEIGRQFLLHAQAIDHEHHELTQLSQLHHSYKLRVGSMNYGKALDVLMKTYTHLNQGSPSFDFQFHFVSLETGLEMLKDSRIDVLVAFLRKSSIETCSWLCNNLGFERLLLTHFPFNLRLREHHPLIQKGVMDDGTFSFNMLKDYPYIDYPSFNKETKLLTVDDNSYQYYSYKMMIDGRENRLKVLAQSDGFCFGVPLSLEEQKHYGIVCYDLPDFDGYLNLIFRKGENDFPEIHDYIETFKKSI